MLTVPSSRIPFARFVGLEDLSVPFATFGVSFVLLFPVANCRNVNNNDFFDKPDNQEEYKLIAI